MKTDTEDIKLGSNCVAVVACVNNHFAEYAPEILWQLAAQPG